MTPEDRVFRLITVYTGPPAILLLVLHAILTKHVAPVLGIIPMGISAGSGLVYSSKKSANSAGNPILDIFLALYLAAVFSELAIFIHGHHGWCGHGDEMLIATYGTVPLVINCSIHTFFALRGTSILDILMTLFSDLSDEFFRSRRCQHCNCECGHGGTASASSDSNDLPVGAQFWNGSLRAQLLERNHAGKESEDADG